MTNQQSHTRIWMLIVIALLVVTILTIVLVEL